MLNKKDLLEIKSLPPEEMLKIFDSAGSFETPNKTKKLSTLSGKTIINFFLEASTRTRTSFEVAGKRLSADVINVGGTSTSIAKGETLVDTAKTLDAMSPDCIVVRHGHSGVPHQIARFSEASVVNAGDGAHEHPTQALIDAYTIRKRKGRLNDLKVAIIGDILHSRVARSNLFALTAFKSHVWLCGAPTLMPPELDKMSPLVSPFLHVTNSMDEAIDGADVVMMLRIQFERMIESFFPSTREYCRYFGLNEERMKLANQDAIVMHPGPINRGIEITAAVADGPYSVILDQVSAGVAVRMAILCWLLGDS